jgi:hypothetical protein
MPPRTLSEDEFNAVKAKVLDSLPAGLSEDDFNRVVGPRMEQALGEAENSPPPLQGSATSRFFTNAGEMLNPVALVKGVAGAVAHPIDTLSNIYDQAKAQAGQAIDLAKQGRYTEAVGHAGAAAIPLLGPMAAQAGEQIASGDIAGGLGKSVGLVAPAATPAVLRVGARVLQAAPESAAAAAEAGAASRIADVMAPKGRSAAALRMSNTAQAIAPQLVADVTAAPTMLTRDGLQQVIASKFLGAQDNLDAVADARLSARTFPTQPIVDDLLAKRARLTAQPVEASQYPPQMTDLTPRGDVGVLSKPVAQPVGEDVVPAPNQARVSAIDQAIKEVKALGPDARYESLRRIREAWDAPASVKYSPSVTADFLKNQGYATGAADVTGSLRDSLARFDPETAQANGTYSLYRKANDVLDATQEIEKASPRVGRQIAARIMTTFLGEQAAGMPGMVGGFLAAPIVEQAASAGITTKLATAKLLGTLAEAARRGDVGYVNSLSVQLQRLGRNALRQAGNATSPSESQTQTTGLVSSTP